MRPPEFAFLIIPFRSLFSKRISLVRTPIQKKNPLRSLSQKRCRQQPFCSESSTTVDRRAHHHAVLRHRRRFFRCIRGSRMLHKSNEVLLAGRPARERVPSKFTRRVVYPKGPVILGIEQSSNAEDRRSRPAGPIETGSFLKNHFERASRQWDSACSLWLLWDRQKIIDQNSAAIRTPPPTPRWLPYVARPWGATESTSPS